MKSVLLDTGILLRGLGQRCDADAEDCQMLLDLLVRGGVTMYVGAPTVAEMSRGAGALGPLPFEIINFDRSAAEVCGRTFPAALLKDAAPQVGLREHYIKYDALIVACALTARVDAVVTLDRGMHFLCGEADLYCYLPSEFCRRLSRHRRY